VCFDSDLLGERGYGGRKEGKAMNFGVAEFLKRA
jgi:hypothetical protein